MASITSWTRLEPRCRDETLSEGLPATLHDPLWMLARQWQLGEFTAHDGGAPVLAHIRTVSAPLSRYRPGTGEHAGQVHPYDPHAQPLEVLIAGDVPDEPEHGSSDLRAAAEAGVHFARLLKHHGAGDYAAVYRERYAIEPPHDDSPAGISADAARVLSVVAGRVIDGTRLYRVLAQLPRDPDGNLGELPPEPPIAGDDHDDVAIAAGSWLTWYEQTYGVHNRPRPAWNPERMTHEFATSAMTGHGEVAVEAVEHPGDRLDWHSFDHAPSMTLRNNPAADDEAQEVLTTALPGRVRYRGMPTSRWWEFEDARVDYGAIETGPEDLARLLFIELAITYGNDWFLVPVDIDVGSLCEVRSLIVTDTFGRRTLIRHYTDVDGPDSAWRMFDHATEPGHPVGRMLLLAPSLPASHHGPAVEEVLLRRDTLASLAWAVEQTVPDVIGKPVDRRAGALSGDAGQPDESREPRAPYAYRLSTEVPAHWLPLVPVQGPSPGSVRLVRGRMHATDDERQGTALGTVLRPNRPLALLDQDLPRAGLRVTRRDERTRWSDGSTHLWRSHRRLTAGGEAWSGLRHDIIQAPAAGGGSN